MHNQQEGFPILIIEIILPKEGLHQIITLIEELMFNLLIDEVIVLQEIIHQEVHQQGHHLHLQEVHQQDHHPHLQEVHLLQEVRLLQEAHRLLLEAVQDVKI